MQVKTRNIATFEITPEAIKSLFNLPDNIEVIGGEWNFISDSMRLYIEGEQLPETNILERPKSISPTITKDENGKLVWDFNVNNINE